MCEISLYWYIVVAEAVAVAVVAAVVVHFESAGVWLKFSHPWPKKLCVSMRNKVQKIESCTKNTPNKTKRMENGDKPFLSFVWFMVVVVFNSNRLRLPRNCCCCCSFALFFPFFRWCKSCMRLQLLQCVVLCLHISWSVQDAPFNCNTA